MTALLTRRARAQWPLLLALLTVLTVGATLLGVSALLVTHTSERAVEVAASRADPADVEVTAYDVQIKAADAVSVAADTRSVLTSAVEPFPATTSARASSIMRSLPEHSDERRSVLSEGYLSGVEGLESKARLLTGRWPAKAGETAVFDSTADRLGITVGSKVRLGPELGRDPAPPMTLTVAGLVRPLPDAGWDRDPLGGSGFDPDPGDAAFADDVDAYGPFLVDLDELLTGGSAIERLEVTARPDLSAPRGRDLDRVSSALRDADRRLGGTLGERVRIERVSSPLPQVLEDARRQQELTAGSVLALALIGILLTAVALALAGRLAAGVRAEESALFTALGTSPGQAAALAATEAAALAVLAAVLAVPASSFLHSALTHLPPLSGAGLATGPVVTGIQVVAVACGALALALLHIGLAVRPAVTFRGRGEMLARSGADLLLLALAGVGWWQLYSQPAAAGTRADAVRVLAPALVLTAGTALVLRALPPSLRRAETYARRARGFVLPLATFQAARRPQAYAAGLLIGLGCAAATFGTAFGTTWTASQHDQADLSVGTDLVITLDGPAAAGQGAAIRAATGGVVSPVADRNIAVGQWLGGRGEAPRLVAVSAAAPLRGRGASSVVAGFAPSAPVTGPALSRGARVSITGTASRDTPVTVIPRLLLQDDSGLRTSCTGPQMVLDGRPHAIKGCVPADGLKLVGVSLPIDSGWEGDPTSAVDITVKLPASSAGSWQARAASPSSQQLRTPAVAATGRRLRLTATVQFADPAPISRTLVATTFDDPGPLPLAVSTRFADDVGARVGTELSLTYGNAPVPAVVTAIVPTIPSAPGAPAALTDVDALSRALVTHGELESPVTAWWVGDPSGSPAGLHLGTITTRAGEAERLIGSPLRASLPAVLKVLVAAAVALLLGGVVLHVSSDVQLRALEVARLRGLGVRRRDVRRSLLTEHAAVLLPLIVAGALVGALATRAVAPLLIRSDTGAAPVPSAVIHWPWAGVALLLVLLIAGAGLAAAAVVTVQARRADAAHLRVAS
ncbi:FtsX-like permease family protein [Nucisporomicrobium flavum]|uniref:FtsX-like permease family protein n=1 Tax=Nucisporomicrobium flavum TaxID=2785915 RepID=UPI0018F3FF7F|nr:FtsX-like permease family protein [Nucisporomicrobium flavum]